MSRPLLIQRWEPTAILFLLGREKEIQNTDITHAALTSISTPARMRSPCVPAAVHTGLEVMMTQAVSVSKVDITILNVLASPDRRYPDITERMEVTSLGPRLFLERILKREPRNCGRLKQNFSQRPIALPMASAPK